MPEFRVEPAEGQETFPYASEYNVDTKTYRGLKRLRESLHTADVLHQPQAQELLDNLVHTIFIHLQHSVDILL